MKTVTTKIIREAMHILAGDIQSEDGIANMAILQAAERLKELEELIEKLVESGQLLKNELVLCDDYSPAKSGTTIRWFDSLCDKANNYRNR